jgi:cytochrome b
LTFLEGFLREIDVHLVELLARISRLYIAASATSATRFFKLERLLALLVGYEET